MAVVAPVPMAADSPAEVDSTEAVLLVAITAALTGAIAVVAPVTAEGGAWKAAAVPTADRVGDHPRWALPVPGLPRDAASAIPRLAGTDLKDQAMPAACPRGQEVPEWLQGPVMQV